MLVSLNAEMVLEGGLVGVRGIELLPVHTLIHLGTFGWSRPVDIEHPRVRTASARELEWIMSQRGGHPLDDLHTLIFAGAVTPIELPLTLTIGSSELALARP